MDIDKNFMEGCRSCSHYCNVDSEGYLCCDLDNLLMSLCLRRQAERRAVKKAAKKAGKRKRR